MQFEFDDDGQLVKLGIYRNWSGEPQIPPTKILRSRLAAALPASTPAAPTGWQPIATAPKDGTPVLVIFRGKYHVARYAPLWAADNLRWIVDHPKWRDEDMQMVSEIDPNEHQRAYGLEGPTHWMPLPAAPTETP